MEAIVYDNKRKEVGKISLPDNIFGIVINHDLLKQVLTARDANIRQITAHVKDRSEVSGGGKKPWRQKGTGRARHSSIRSPLWKGGGVTFGPSTDRNYTKQVNAKMRRKALFMALSSKVKDNEYMILDTLNIDVPKTKDMSNLVSTLLADKGDQTVLIVTSVKNRNVEKSAKNIPTVHVLPANSLHAYDILKSRNVIFIEDSIKIIEKTYKA